MKHLIYLSVVFQMFFATLPSMASEQPGHIQEQNTTTIAVTNLATRAQYRIEIPLKREGKDLILDITFGDIKKLLSKESGIPPADIGLQLNKLYRQGVIKPDDNEKLETYRKESLSSGLFMLPKSRATTGPTAIQPQTTRTAAWTDQDMKTAAINFRNALQNRDYAVARATADSISDSNRSTEDQKKIAKAWLLLLAQ